MFEKNIGCGLWCVHSVVCVVFMCVCVLCVYMVGGTIFLDLSKTFPGIFIDESVESGVLI